jgi:hypothetical protein
MTIPDIIDNSEYQLFDVLNELLETEKPVDFASGFFNNGGYALVRGCSSKRKNTSLVTFMKVEKV